ncbi:hypothetical protein M885DRAFT_532366, partial [Pelagophyceae sp. CCMP2097]
MVQRPRARRRGRDLPNISGKGSALHAQGPAPGAVGPRRRAGGATDPRGARRTRGKRSRGPRRGADGPAGRRGARPRRGANLGAGGTGGARATWRKGPPPSRTCDTGPQLGAAGRAARAESTAGLRDARPPRGRSSGARATARGRTDIFVHSQNLFCRLSRLRPVPTHNVLDCLAGHRTASACENKAARVENEPPRRHNSRRHTPECSEWGRTRQAYLPGSEAERSKPFGVD